MKKMFILFVFCGLLSCKEKKNESFTAQQIVDKAIGISGGDLFVDCKLSFDFRDKHYISEGIGNNAVLKRVFDLEGKKVEDIKSKSKFERYVDGTLEVLQDTVANNYDNSVNSVHYFVKLPYGLNDPAVNKTLLKEVNLKGKEYYKIKVTFDQKGGGEDFEDTYFYWINKESFKTDYLAYDFHVDGGGVRFRKAYNERYIKGIRFVDYENYQPKDSTSTIENIDAKFELGDLELLSKIELKNISVQK
ncbi:DUF6503 family protein [Sediminicola arcticus]|jgi:hypothetical protein|uniref:DUF6503 family protein n=1 Tax=Sediminicola arcticus TaxID=1574308 RepID=A0ABV2SVU8_9FLAO